MNTMEAIAARRSIRRFKPDPVAKETVEALLRAAKLAPSGKNKQPWRFYVVQGDQRAEMVRVMREGMARLEGFGVHLGSSPNTARIMEQAPLTVLVFNPHIDPQAPLDDPGDLMAILVDVQSAGAAIQNLCLAATDMGLGSLWICDVFYAYDELCQWLDRPGQLIGAVSLGYADESPDARPRLTVDEVTTWL